MRVLTLSQNLHSAAHLHPSRPRPFRFSSLNSLLHKQRLKPINRTTFCAISRQSRRWSQYASADEECIKNFLQASTSNVHDSEELGFLDGQKGKVAVEMMHSLQESSDMDKNSVKFNSNSQYHAVTSFNENIAAPEISFFSWLKFLMLIGFFSLQDSQQAVASSGFTTGLNFVPDLGSLGDISTGFASAFLLIFFSELGDKTFFIAALLAARNSGVVIFIGTFGALAAMSIISVVIGRTFHYVDDILPFRFGETDLPLDDIAAVCLLTYFGVSTLIDAASSDSPKAEDEQKEAELAVSEFTGNGAGILAAASTVISTFILVFVAEWGDKSFFSTIALAAASSPLGVIGGAVAGHAAATLLAVLGGSLLGTFLSEKVISYVGGTLFLVFAVVTLIEIVT